MTKINPIKSYFEKRKVKQYLRENTWQDLVPGDIVEYKGRLTLMFRGINQYGGPGMPSTPEPLFGPAHPSEPNVRYYLRGLGEESDLPENIFGEDVNPVQAGSTGTCIGFLNGGRLDFKKVGHITPEYWNKMAEKLRKELGGQTTTH